MRIATVLVVIWLLVGAMAAWQRGHVDEGPRLDCAWAGTTTLTVIAGPLNYVGVNPDVRRCEFPEPSQ